MTPFPRKKTEKPLIPKRDESGNFAFTRAGAGNGRNMKRYLYAAAVAAGVIITAVSVWDLAAGFFEYKTARDEYARLREIYNDAHSPQAGKNSKEASKAERDGSENAGASDGGENGNGDSPPASGGKAASYGMSDINPEFAGWVFINGTTVDYPVARGKDNETYMAKTFSGRKSPSGSIFMDYRCGDGFGGDVCILYGHNMKDGSMFAPLEKYLDREYMAQHPVMTVTDTDGGKSSYRVYDARLTNAWDKAYNLADDNSVAAKNTFANASSGADRLLILSTCINGSDKDVRLLIYFESLDIEG